MDLISIAAAIWRHKLALLPVILIVLAGMFYVLKVKPPEYQASESILLINPPGPPTAAQIARDPKLAKISSANPYTYYGDLDIVADSVMSVVTASSNQLVSEGADPRFTMTLSTDTGFPPIIEVTGVGSTTSGAIRTANIVGTAINGSLRQMQTNAGVNSYYMIKAVVLASPQSATQSVSGKLRELIALLAVGALLAFVVISVTEGAAYRRRQRPGPRTRPNVPQGGDHDTALPTVRSGARRYRHDDLEPESALNRRDQFDRVRTRSRRQADGSRSVSQGPRS
jgi:capsular polysaccharide biosynthesis protein